ncbi:hypothetical protein [Streptococcus sp. FT1-55]|uniref:hypothetical protein n=1 Tax=Streptococcus sp. FT1-55 TaxID=3409805 RepID=UPI003BF48552
MLKLNEIKTTADTTKQNLATYQDTVDRKLTELTTSAQTLDGKINTASTKVDAVAGQIRTEISEVEGKIPTEFGGKNLIKNGGFPTDTNNWSGTIEVDTHSKYYSGTERLFLIKATGVDEVRAATNRFSVKRDTEYTLSFYALIGNNVSSADFFFLGRQNGETDAFTQTVALQKNRLPNKANLEY